MAITITTTKSLFTPSVPLATGLVLKYRNITLDSSYPTGGYDITPAQFGLDTIIAIFASPAAPINDPTQAVVLKYDEGEGALGAFWCKTAGTASLQEVDSTTNLSTFTAHLLILGRGLGN